MSDGQLTALLSFLAHDLIVIALLPVVLLRRKEPPATVAWIFAILLMPIIGALAFLLFGNDRLARRTGRRQARKRRYHARMPQVLGHHGSPIDVKGQLQLYRLLDRLGAGPLTIGNRVALLPDVRDNYERQLAAIEAARHHVHLQYYIFQPDYVGWKFREALERAAARGVAVRFLYDAVGCMNLSRRFLAEMQGAGIQVACFIPFSLWTRRWIYNFRNHRKIVIVDGAVAFTGGSNVGKEYLGESEAGPWFDAQIEVRGPAVLQLQRVFVGDWAFSSGEELTDPLLFPEAPRRGTVAAQIVAGGPDGDVHVYHELFFSAVANAVGRIRIATAYFVPSEAIRVGLETAARRGVDVQIILPARGTHRFVELAGQSYYQALLESGVRIYEFLPGYLHSKILTVDHRWSLLGSANLDNRSMKLNFEVGLVFYDSETTLELDRLLDEYQKSSRRVELSAWRARPLRRRIAENSARLFSSVL